jgi:pyruvate/2-oxoglutarate dehydrogenase complex dihydrolipoamide acyltransferase (E2) component
MPFIVKAASMALRKHPLVNAAYDANNGEIVYKRYINIGMAVDSERGLVVPVLRNTDQLSISEIAKLIASTTEKVRENTFGLEDLRGGTFTISNLGSIGGTYSTPIINLPEVAILLTGRARKMPVVVEDKIVIRLMMPLSLSYDHRLIDGATAARFLNEIIAFLDAPSRLLLAP